MTVLNEKQRLEVLKEKLEPRGVHCLSFRYDRKCFGNMVLCLTYKGKSYSFVLDRGEITENKKVSDTLPGGKNDFWEFVKRVEKSLFGVEEL